jgi:NAD(P)H-dependent FMN reductase
MSLQKILAISGSLRDGSSNTQLLKLLGGWMPENISYHIYQDMGKLPHFNPPAINEAVPDIVQELYRQTNEADAIIICTPEYAFGVPGSLKNLLDWTVGTGNFVDKPVAIITASSVGEHAHASLLTTIGVLSAKIVGGGTLLIPFVRSKMDMEGNVTDEGTLQQLRSVVDKLLSVI